jgi:hypothetical protein
MLVGAAQPFACCVILPANKNKIAGPPTIQNSLANPTSMDERFGSILLPSITVISSVMPPRVHYDAWREQQWSDATGTRSEQHQIKCLLEKQISFDAVKHFEGDRWELF